MGKIDLVVPAYNEAKNLNLIIDRARQAALEAGYNPETFRLIVVQNGSRDESAQILKDLKQSDLGPWFEVVEVEVNQGYGYGLWQGLKATQAPFVAWSHADMQCSPADVFRAMKLLDETPESNVLVKGKRFGRDWKDRFVTTVFESLAYMFLNLKVSEINAQPKVFRSELLQQIANPPNGFSFDLYVLYQARKNGFEFKEIDVAFPPRIHGTSKWASSFFRRYRTIWGMIEYMWQLRSTDGPIASSNE